MMELKRHSTLLLISHDHVNQIRQGGILLDIAMANSKM